MMINLDSIKFIPSPNFSVRGPNVPSMIILHCPVGTLQGTVNTFKNPASKVSAHFVIDRDGSIVQMVHLDKAAWHAMHVPNLMSIGIECVDRYFVNNQLTRGCMGDPNWYTRVQLETLCQLVAALMVKFNIPLFKVIGHNDMSLRKYGNNHADPGTYFPWRTFKDLTPKFAQEILDAQKVVASIPSTAKVRKNAKTNSSPTVSVSTEAQDQETKNQAPEQLLQSDTEKVGE